MHKYDICDRFAISGAFLRAHSAPDGSSAMEGFHKYTNISPQIHKYISTNTQIYFHTSKKYLYKFFHKMVCVYKSVYKTKRLVVHWILNDFQFSLNNAILMFVALKMSLPYLLDSINVK